MRKVMNCVWVLLVAGCVTEPDSWEFEPGPVYGEWAGELMRCAGWGGDPKAVVEGVEWRQALDLGRVGDGVRVGRYDPGARTITLKATAVMRADVVKHELIHHMVPGHDRMHFSPLFTLCTGAR